jgi:molybdopterin molybdotransferase
MKVKREEAKEIIFNSVKPVDSTETVTLEKAQGRVLVQNVISPIDVPDVNKSAIDGFAFNSASVENVPARLKVVGETAAGSLERKAVKKGEAVFVMTGAEIPEGADSAVRVEDVKLDREYVVIPFSVEKGNLVNFKGEEFKKGEKVLEKGEFLDSLKISLLAYLGIYSVKVFQKPKVGILVTGNEVLEPWESLRKGAVYNSNYYFIKGFIEKNGGEVVYFGIAKDEKDYLKEEIVRALKKVDVLITTGGVSKGKYDFVKEVAPSAGIEVKFTQTNIRPGRPLVFGTKGEKLFFGLPGYPSAALVNLVEFVLPAIRKFAGFKNWQNTYVQAEALEDLKSRPHRNDFVRIKLIFESGKLGVRSAGSQQTSVFRSSVFSDGFAVIPEGKGTVQKGELVEVLTL